MKLYTEEQVKRAIDIADDNTDLLEYNEILSKLTPIELPSDEEIYLYSNAMYPDFVWELEGAMIRKFAHSNGAKWVIEQIKQKSIGH